VNVNESFVLTTALNEDLGLEVDVGAALNIVAYAVAVLLRRELAGVPFADIDLQARLGNLGTISFHLVGDRKAFTG